MKQQLDEEYVKDLYLSAVNDGEIYQRCGLPCIENLRRKIKRGVFDETKAPRLFELAFLDLAREAYSKNVGIKPRMSREEKELFGKLVFEFYEEEIRQ